MTDVISYKKLGKSIKIKKLSYDFKSQISILFSNLTDSKELNIPLLQNSIEELSKEKIAEYISLNSYYFLVDEENNSLIGLFYLNIQTNEVYFVIANGKRNQGYGKAGMHLLLKELSKDHPEIKEYFFPIKKTNKYASLVVYGNNGKLTKETEDCNVLSISKDDNLWYHRISEKEELPRIMEITNQAKKLLKASGSMQWQTGYPNEETFLRDIDNKSLYGLYEDEKLVGYGAYILGKDENYIIIKDGNWEIPANDKDMSIHRVAVDESKHGKRYGVKILEYGIKHAAVNGCLTVKVDTHRLNKPMQKSIERSGLIYKGIINVNTDKVDSARLAYEIILNK